MDPATMETIGFEKFGGKMTGQTFTAHPKIDPATGKLTRSGGIEETFLTGTAPTVYSSPGGAVANDGADDSFLLGQFED